MVNWAQETFCFTVGVEVSEPKAEDEQEYISFQDALCEFNIPVDLVPATIPDEFSLSDIKVEETPMQRTYIAVYENNEALFKVTVRTFRTNRPEQIEKSGNIIEQYTARGVDYYIFSNYNQNRAVWLIGEYECSISGQVSVDSIKTMIESIGRD